MRRLLLLLLGLVLSIGVIAGAVRYPLALDRHILFAADNANSFVHLTAGQTLRQGYRGTGGLQSGITLLTGLPILTDQHVEVIIRDKAGHELARGVSTLAPYYQADDTVRLRINHAWIKTTAHEQLHADIRLTHGTLLPLRAARTDFYRGGDLLRDGQGIEADLPLQIVTQVPLSPDVYNGAIGGVVFGMSLLLIHTYVRRPRLQWWLTGALVVAVTPLALGGFWFSSGVLGIADWDYYFSLHESYRQSILTHHAFPFWNPYTCGGTAGLADPEFPVFSATFLLELLFGVPVGVRLAIFAALSVQGLGMLLLAKSLKLSPLAATVAALTVTFSSVTILEIVEGHSNIFAAMWVPWILWSWLLAWRAEPSDAAKGWWRGLLPTRLSWLCSLFLALTFLRGGVYLLMYTALVLGVVSLLCGRPRAALRTTWRAGVGALGLSAFKLIPVLLWLREFPDESYASSAYFLPWLTEVLFGRHRHGTYIIFQQGSGWHEYGAYVGLLVFGLALIGVTGIWRSRTIGILALGVVAVILVSSSGPALKPFFDAVPYIPRSNISRLMIYAVFSLALLAGFGLDRLTARSPRRVQRGLPLLVVGLIAVDLMSLSSALSAQSFVLPEVYHPVLTPHPIPPKFTQNRYSYLGQEIATTRAYAATRVGYGTFAYCSVLGPHPAVETIEDEGERTYVRAYPGDHAQVRLESWTPNEVRVAVTATDKAKIAINTNYAPGWHTNGQPSGEFEGRVATTVPAGTNQLIFRYHTPGWWVGLSVTVLSIVFCLWQLASGRLRRQDRLATTSVA